MNRNDTCWISKDKKSGRYHGNIFRTTERGNIIPSRIDEESISFIRKLTDIDYLLDEGNNIELFSDGTMFKVFIGKVSCEGPYGEIKVFNTLYSSKGYSFNESLFNLNRNIKQAKKSKKVKLYRRGDVRYE